MRLSRCFFALVLSTIASLPLVVTAQAPASAACAPSVRVVDFMWGSIMGSASYAGCTIREGDRLCLQKEIGPNNWHSVVDCRGASYMKGVTGVDTFAHGCTNHPSYFGKYRAYAIIGGRAYSSSYRYCSS